MAASYSTCSGPVDLMDAHIQCPACLGIEHLREALVDPCPECNLMYFEVRQQRLAIFEPQVQNLPAPARAKVHTGSKRSASKTEELPRKKRTNSTTVLQHYPTRWLSNAVQGIQALLAMSCPSATQNINEEMRGSVFTSSLPRFDPAAKCSREETLCL